MSDPRPCPGPTPAERSQGQGRRPEDGGLREDESDSTKARLAEFAALRQETGQRASHQQALIALNVTVMGAVSGLVLTNRTSEELLVVIAFAASVFGLLWLDHHLSIHQIAGYIQRELWLWEPSWEEYARRHGKPRWWQVTYVLLVAAIFSGTSIAALCVSTSEIHGSMRIVWYIGALLTALTTGSFIAILTTGSGRVK